MSRTKYLLKEKLVYYSERYNKQITLHANFPSDGATGAFDISGPVSVWDVEHCCYRKVSKAWMVHDKLCRRGSFDCGTPVTNWQASTILSDILRSEKRYFRQFYWWGATWLFGGDKARENGMF